MTFRGLKSYIMEGKGDFNLRIDFPKQPEDDIDRVFEINSRDEYGLRYVQKMLGTNDRIAMRADYTGADIIYLTNLVLDGIPYKFRGDDGKKWDIWEKKCRCMEDKDDRRPTNMITIVNVKKEFPEIMRVWKREIEKRKRSQRTLGQAFRYNKILIENGYEPESFRFVERGDLFWFSFPDHYTLSEIRWHAMKGVFVRDGVRCWMRDGKMTNMETGKEMNWELGYEAK